MSAEPDPPSARAVERLAAGVGEDVADLRAQLHQALARADSLEADGRQDLAVVVLQEQREVLLDVHRRLEARLADAAVEREAERVVDAAPVGGGATSGSGSASGSHDDGLALRLVVSAAAAVLGVTLLLSPGSGSVRVTAASSGAAGDAAASGQRHGGDPVADPGASAGPDAARGPDVASTVGPAGRASESVGPTDLRALPIPEAHVLAPTPDEEDDEEGKDGGDADLGGLTEPLSPPDPGLELPPPEAPVLPVSEGGDDREPGDEDRDSGDGAEPADSGESELLGR